MPTKKQAVSESEESARKNYQNIKEYEHHFNSLETEMRKLASVWLFAALGAVAYLIKGAYLGDAGADTSKLLLEPRLLIALVCLMGNLGLLVLWILDQMVYHRLLNAVFLLGLRMEYKFRHLPPIRTLMMLYSSKRGMARYMRFYYFIPMFVLSMIAAYFNVWMGAANAIILMLAYVKSKRMEEYKEIAQGFGDPEFVRYLGDRNFEKILAEH